MLKKFFHGLIVCASFLFAASAFSKNVPKEITIATEGAYPPWSYTKPDGSLAGYEIDMIKILCQRMQEKCKVVSQEWNGIIPGLQARKYDAIIASMGVTKARKKSVDFSEPYAKSPNGFLTLDGNSLQQLPYKGKSLNLATDLKTAKAAINAIREKFKGKVIGVQTGSTAAYFVKKYFKGIETSEYPSFEQLALDLKSGRVDVAVANVTAFRGIMLADPATHYAYTGPSFVGGVLGLGTTNVALRKGDTKLKSLFNKGIKSINSDGTNAALSKKWFGMDISIHQ